MIIYICPRSDCKLTYKTVEGAFSHIKGKHPEWLETVDRKKTINRAKLLKAAGGNVPAEVRFAKSQELHTLLNSLEVKIFDEDYRKNTLLAAKSHLIDPMAPVAENLQIRIDESEESYKNAQEKLEKAKQAIFELSVIHGLVVMI